MGEPWGVPSTAQAEKQWGFWGLKNEKTVCGAFRLSKNVMTEGRGSWASLPAKGVPWSPLCPPWLGPRLWICGKGPENKASGFNLTSVYGENRPQVAHLGRVTRNP